jgi:hypothetical protein
MNYLLPCPACGQKSTVSSAQAGQSLRCACGQSLEVPAMRDMRQLEPVGESAIPQSTWNRRKGMVFLGCTLIATAAIGGGYLAWRMPRDVDPVAVRAEVDTLDPAGTFVCYQALRRSLPVESPIGGVILGPVKPLLHNYFENPYNQFLAFRQLGNVAMNAQEREALSHWMPLVGAVAAVGLLITLSALIVRGESSRPAPKRAAAASKSA